MGEMHIVPLARQAVDILRELPARTGGSRHVCPAIGKRERLLGENTLNAALRRRGYAKEEMTARTASAVSASAD
jgi:hypothetical protein